MYFSILFKAAEDNQQLKSVVIIVRLLSGNMPKGTLRRSVYCNIVIIIELLMEYIDALSVLKILMKTKIFLISTIYTDCLFFFASLIVFQSNIVDFQTNWIYWSYEACAVCQYFSVNKNTDYLSAPICNITILKFTVRFHKISKFWLTIIIRI